MRIGINRNLNLNPNDSEIEIKITIRSGCPKTGMRSWQVRAGWGKKENARFRGRPTLVIPGWLAKKPSDGTNGHPLASQWRPRPGHKSPLEKLLS
jgi:hypothetical protein